MKTVRLTLVDVPVAVLLRSLRHSDDLVRELTLAAMNRPDDNERMRLVTTAERLNGYGTATRDMTFQSIRRATERGEDSITLEFNAPDETATVTEEWGQLCQELDDFARSGGLLTLPAVPDVAALRRWVVRETVGQLRDGAAPVPWGDYQATGS